MRLCSGTSDRFVYDVAASSTPAVAAASANQNSGFRWFSRVSPFFALQACGWCPLRPSCLRSALSFPQQAISTSAFFGLHEEVEEQCVRWSNSQLRLHFAKSGAEHQNILKTVEVPLVHFSDMETVLIHVVLQRRFRKLRSHRTVWQQQYDPSGQYGRRRKILSFSFLSIRGHPRGNKTTSADVPEGAKIDLYTQESCAFVVLSEIPGCPVL